MTPGEFSIVLRGHQERYNRAREIEAWALSYQLLYTGNVKRGAQHTVSPDKLLRGCPGYLDKLKMESIYGE